eukprot:3117039-Pyramimonas_sp.AAC.1
MASIVRASVPDWRRESLVGAEALRAVEDGRGETDYLRNCQSARRSENGSGEAQKDEEDNGGHSGGSAQGRGAHRMSICNRAGMGDQRSCLR